MGGGFYRNEGPSDCEYNRNDIRERVGRQVTAFDGFDVIRIDPEIHRKSHNHKKQARNAI